MFVVCISLLQIFIPLQTTSIYRSLLFLFLHVKASPLIYVFTTSLLPFRVGIQFCMDLLSHIFYPSLLSFFLFNLLFLSLKKNSFSSENCWGIKKNSLIAMMILIIINTIYVLSLEDLLRFLRIIWWRLLICVGWYEILTNMGSRSCFFWGFMIGMSWWVSVVTCCIPFLLQVTTSMIRETGRLTLVKGAQLVEYNICWLLWSTIHLKFSRTSFGTKFPRWSFFCWCDVCWSIGFKLRITWFALKYYVMILPTLCVGGWGLVENVDHLLFGCAFFESI